MNNLVFHNNYHRSNHHTVALSSYPESAKDPIASLKFPFLGTFYNDYYDINENYIGQSNSYEWWNAYTITNSNSSIWEKYLTTYTTVCSNSGFWEKGYDAYETMLPISGNWESTFQTLCDNIDYWNAVYDENTVFSNKVQQYTKQKTFRNLSINPTNKSNIILDLSAGQVTTYVTDQDSNFSGFYGQKKGGIYHLILITDARSNPNLKITFNSNNFLFTNNQDTYNYVDGLRLTKFHFLCDGDFLHGKSAIYDTELIVDPIVSIFDALPIIEIGGTEQIFTM